MHRFENNRTPGRLRQRMLRRGVSLLEVMFSIGVVMIGLLAVAALLPMAGLQVSKGVIADHAATLGRAAISDFQMRGMGNPENWRIYDAASNSFNVVAPENRTAEQSFCIDPRFVAEMADVAEVDANRFPVHNTVNAMPRITLASGQGAGGLGSLQADQLFMSQDELVFDLPRDRTIGPVQNFGPNNQKRQTQGRMSWMATLVPQLDRQGNPIREYTLSVVVFSQRVLLPESERVALVAEFYSGSPAWSGGDVLLETRAGQPSDDLELDEGDWIMLSGRKYTTGPATFVPVHKWYQVVAVDDELGEPRTQHNLATRHVTLVGPDWDYGNLFSGWAWEDSRVTTQATIVRGVVSVFEKTIRLETSSLWMNQ